MRLRSFIAAIFLPVLLLAQGMSHQEKKVRRLLAKGRAYPAIRVATGALGRDHQPVFYALRAKAYNSIGEFAKAEKDARSAVRLMPDSVSGLFELAMAEQGQGRLDSAGIHLTQVVELAPSVNDHYSLAVLRQKQGRLSAAMQQIDQALAEGADTPASASLHRVKGEVAAMAGDTALARTELDRAVALAPDDPVNYNSRGYYAHAWLGDHRAAIIDYDRAIKLNPNYSYAFNNRGWSEYKTGETDKGIKDIQRARKKKAYNPYVYRNLGVIALESGDTTKACMLLRQALDRGFTALFGDEVKERVAASCGNSPTGPQSAPVQPAQSTFDRKDQKPGQRTNAPE